MQGHQQVNGDQEVPAAHVRVKAEELAQALAAIELRRQEEARRLEGTVVIGDAVQELHLDVTPDELLAEVQAQRVRRQEEAETERTRPPEAWPFFWLVSKVLGSVVGAFMLLAWIMSLSTRPSPPAPPITVTPTITGAQDTPTGTPLTQPDSSLLPLSSIPDRMPFGCSFRTVDQILSDTAPSQIMITHEERNRTYDEAGKAGFDSGAAPNVRSSWTAIKYGGKVYLRGWVVQRFSTASKAAHTLHVFNSSDVPELGPRPVRITLAATPLDYQGLFMRIDNPLYNPPSLTKGHPLYQRLTQEIAASSVHLDSHAWEKWQ